MHLYVVENAHEIFTFIHYSKAKTIQERCYADVLMIDYNTYIHIYFFRTLFSLKTVVHHLNTCVKSELILFLKVTIYYKNIKMINPSLKRRVKETIFIFTVRKVRPLMKCNYFINKSITSGTVSYRPLQFHFWQFLG